MNFLDEMLALKRARVEAAKRAKPFGALQDEARRVRKTARRNALHSALSRAERINIVAEIKRASPSKGEINARVDVGKQAKLYEAGGACAISVLTEEDRFRGSLEDLRSVKGSVSIPVLRKDFIFDEYQVYETAAAGADALLLIVAALEDEKLCSLRRLTEDELKMDALVEVHTVEEAHRAIACDARIIGVNNRDLRTFDVSLQTSYRIARELKKDEQSDFLLISESGLQTAQDLRDLRAVGFNGFLIGESLMRADDAVSMLRELSGAEVLAADERG